MGIFVPRGISDLNFSFQANLRHLEAQSSHRCKGVDIEAVLGTQLLQAVRLSKEPGRFVFQLEGEVGNLFALFPKHGVQDEAVPAVQIQGVDFQSVSIFVFLVSVGEDYVVLVLVMAIHQPGIGHVGVVAGHEVGVFVSIDHVAGGHKG